jgi:iron complex transport system permease protein
VKITLDLTELVARGELSQPEADRLKRLAAKDTGSLAANILIGFGIVVVACGAGALIPTTFTAMVIGALLLALGLALRLTTGEQWSVLAQICLVLGALALGAGIVAQWNSLYVAYAVTLGLAIAAAVARSGLLAAIAVLALASCLGSSTDYFHATYVLSVPEPAISVAVFSVLALGLYLASKRVPAAYERVAIIASRAAILIVNVAFLVGSLWGDARAGLSDVVFVVGWAVAIVGTGAWAVWANRRWVVNVAAVFGVIHFYTQWFERLGATPTTVLLGGLLMLAFGFGVWTLNRRWRGRATPPAATASA